jgi:hypothetical protein
MSIVPGQPIPSQAGQSGKFLTTNGSVLSWGTAGGGSPGGSSGELQWNNAGSFAGAAWSAVAASGSLLTVTSPAATDIPFTVRKHASQSGKLVVYEDSDGTDRLTVKSDYSWEATPSGGGTTTFALQQYGFKVDVVSAANDFAEMLFDAPGTASNKYSFRLENRSGGIFPGNTAQWQFGDFNTGGFGLYASRDGAGYMTYTDPCEWHLVRPTSGDASKSKVGSLRAAWVDATDATRTGRIDLGAWYTTTFNVGVRVDAVSASGANVALFGAGSWGGGVKALFIANAATNPSTDPIGGGILYADGGALKWRGSSGTVTTIANA